MSTGAIVVGTDGTLDSDEALRFAAKEAALRGSELVVVYSYVGPIDPDVDDFETPKSVQIQRHALVARAALCRALGVGPDELPPHRIVCDDLEASALLVRSSAGAEMIVVGQHRRHLLDRLFHGPSRAGGIAWRTHVPVTVVPEPTVPGEDAPEAQSQPPNR